jgi:Methylamine utilisation protein MauE
MLERITEKNIYLKEKTVNHEHEMKQPMQQKPNYTLKDFLPLIIIFSTIVILTLFGQVLRGWNLTSAMSDFMGFFFLIFGGFKVLNLKGFAEAYSIYDIFAKQSKLYAYAYPFIELTLGALYLLRLFPLFTNVFTLALMLVSSIGVAQELLKGKEIMCACLGAVFKIPMTWVTLTEDLLMAAMALIMLRM